MYRTFPPSQASAQADAQCDADATTAEKPLWRISAPMRMPARRLPPLLSSTTMACVSVAVLARKSSSSLRTKVPWIETYAGSFGPRCCTAIEAASPGLATNTNVETRPRKSTRTQRPQATLTADEPRNDTACRQSLEAQAGSQTGLAVAPASGVIRRMTGYRTPHETAAR